MKRFGELLIVVDLDNSYVPRSSPTVFNRTELPHSLEGLEDPRLFVHRGELYLLAAGYYTIHLGGGLNKHMWDTRQYLARIERLPGAAKNTTGAGPAEPAGFRIVQLRQVLLPEDVPSALTLPADMDMRKPLREKNWVPFIYDDSIHFIYSLNPPVVIRVVADSVGADHNEDIRTEFVSDGGNTTIRWRYGVMRGGTPAIYDADIGGYVAFFHSHDKYRVKTRTGDKDVTYYFMGFYVFAAQPPFGIQLISEAPLMGPGFYNESAPNANRLRVVWPAGLMVLPDSFVVSYGRDDHTTRVVRIDRRKLIETLQAPLPREWKGPPC